MIFAAVTVAALTSILGAIWYYFYIPTPDGMAAEDKRLLRMFYSFRQMGKLLGAIGQAVGYDNSLNIQRWFSNLKKAPKVPNPDIQSKKLLFDGVPVTVHRKNAWLMDDAQKRRDKLRPAIFYMHGGGWVFGVVEANATFERHFVRELDMVLVSVDYRLAPEHPYPEPFNDCFTAMLYFKQHCEEFGVDPTKITIMGDSAGGNMATAIALKLRDSGLNFLHRQILISPALQCTTFLTKSAIENADSTIYYSPPLMLSYMNEPIKYLAKFEKNGHLSERMVNHPAWRYLKKYQSDVPAVERDDILAATLEPKIMDPYMFPIMADSLSGLPPALMLTSTYDALRDEELAYADRLQAEGTDTTVFQSDGFHAIYCFYQSSRVGSSMVESIINYIGKSLE